MHCVSKYFATVIPPNSGRKKMTHYSVPFFLSKTLLLLYCSLICVLSNCKFIHELGIHFVEEPGHKEELVFLFMYLIL